MLTLIISLLVIGIIICYLVYRKSDDGDCASILMCIMAFVLFGCVFGEVLTFQDCRKLDYMNDTIQMYTDENNKIETQMDTIVKNYMQYENKTVTTIAPKSGIQLISLYPQLKSDKLVSNEMQIYLDNNNKIKELKQQQIDKRICKWWLYFS